VSQLALSLLGPPRVERDGRAIRVDTRKATALIAYLGVTGEPHTRDSLAALLRPEYDQTSARAARQPDQAARLREIPAHWLGEAARLVPGLATLRPDLPPAPPLDSPGAQSRFFEGVSRALPALLTGDRPGVLCIDAASLDLLTYLARRLRERPIRKQAVTIYAEIGVEAGAVQPRIWQLAEW